MRTAPSRDRRRIGARDRQTPRLHCRDWQFRAGTPGYGGGNRRAWRAVQCCRSARAGFCSLGDSVLGACTAGRLAGSRVWTHQGPEAELATWRVGVALLKTRSRLILTVRALAFPRRVWTPGTAAGSGISPNLGFTAVSVYSTTLRMLALTAMPRTCQL